MSAGIMVRCAQCHGKGVFVLYRGRGREFIKCTCLAATTAGAPDPAHEALKAKLLAAFREEMAKDAKK